jgi:agmatinase
LLAKKIKKDRLMNQTFLSEAQPQTEANHRHKKIFDRVETDSAISESIENYDFVNSEQTSCYNKFFPKDESINNLQCSTFLKTPFLNKISQLKFYDIGVLGIPYVPNSDRKARKEFGAQCIRYISSHLFKQEIGMNLRQKVKICDLGDLNLFQQENNNIDEYINKQITPILNTGLFPIILGGDRTSKFSRFKGIFESFQNSKIGFINFDSKISSQTLNTNTENNLDINYYSQFNNFKNIFKNIFVQLGVNDSQVSTKTSNLNLKNSPHNVFTVETIAELGLNTAADLALKQVLKNVDRLYISIDVSCIAGSESSESESLLPREVVYLVDRIIKKAPICGLEVVGVSPPNDIGNIDAMMATRIICETIDNLINAQQLPKKTEGF